MGCGSQGNWKGECINIRKGVREGGGSLSIIIIMNDEINRLMLQWAKVTGGRGS